MKVTQTSLPADSLTRKYLPADHVDVFACEVQTDSSINPDDIMVSFWTNSPAWVNGLFKIRNFIVKFVGLKGDENSSPEKLEECVRKGESLGIISIPDKNDHETVMLLTDKHLDAYMAVHIERGENKEKVSIITLVHFKNRLGRIYFAVIAPFHNIIVKRMLERAIRLQVISKQKKED